jgi:copper chaperone
MSQTVTLDIPAISCHHCTNTIARETKDLPGVIEVKGDPQAKTATFTVANDAALIAVRETLVEIGYPPAN